MAATTIKPYPHVQINVKDNSIATIDFVENLPVHRPLYVMRTQKGPLGEPVWCNTYSEAAALFGAETFNPANKEYFSLPALYLRDTFTRNGAFVTRYLPKSGSSTAASVLYARVISVNVPQYEKQGDYRKTVWDKDKYEFVDKSTGEYETGLQIEFYSLPLTKDISEYSWEVKDIPTTPYDDPYDPYDGLPLYKSFEFPIAIFAAKDPGKYGNDLAYKLFYSHKANDAGDVNAYGTLFYNIGFAEREYDSTTWDAITDIYSRESCSFAANPNTINPDSGTSMSVDYVLDKSFSDSAHELPVNFWLFEENINAIGLLIASYEPDTMLDSSLPESIVEAAYADGYTDGNIIYVNPFTGEYRANGSLSLNSNDGDATIGALTWREKQIVRDYYINGGSEKPESTFGYKVNVISGRNVFNVPYDHVIVVKDAEKKAIRNAKGQLVAYVETNEDTNSLVDPTVANPNNPIQYVNDKTIEIDDESTFYGQTQVSLTDFFNIPLIGGSDGTYYVPERSGEGMVTPNNIGDETSPLRIIATKEEQSSDDEAMYKFVKLKLKWLDAITGKYVGVGDRIVESLRFPFTHIFDVGYSMKTKKAICDFLDVRDDFVFIASPQVLYADGSGRAIKWNEQVDDEANTEALRSYALLMRESVLYGTDCMRVSIYEHSGHLVNSTYQGVVPHTYWAAVQYSQYGNLTYMNTTEPRGLPYSYNLLFKDQNWTNYRADSQSRVWDEGGNYVQYADMTRLFYPALRTVYRAATSVLIDEWVVAAVVYTKYVARRAWARFSGRNDYASILQDAIKKYIDTELKYLFNGKYSFNVSVYQTAEEQELGYIQHVKISITFGATMRVLDVDIEVNREGFVPEE